MFTELESSRARSDSHEAFSGELLGRVPSGRGPVYGSGRLGQVSGHKMMLSERHRREPVCPEVQGNRERSGGGDSGVASG